MSGWGGGGPGIIDGYCDCDTIIIHFAINLEDSGVVNSGERRGGGDNRLCLMVRNSALLNISPHDIL